MSTGAGAVTPARSNWKLWVVGVLALLWNAMGALDYVMTQTRNAEYLSRFTPEQLGFIFGYPAWVIALWALAVWGGVLGAVLLLLRRRAAEPVFLVSLVAMVITTVHSYVLSNGLEVFPDAFTKVFTAVIFGVALGLYLYSRALGRSGVLR